MDRKAASPQKAEKVVRKQTGVVRQAQPEVKPPGLNQESSRLSATPFTPRSPEHAAFLSTRRSPRSRTDLILDLQRTYGNRYVQRLLGTLPVQAKLNLSSPADAAEVEADRVAATVVRLLPQLQRQEDEEELQLSPIDRLQRQEDEEELQLSPANQLQRQEDEEELQLSPVDRLQRQEDEEELQLSPANQLQRQEDEEELQLSPVDRLQRQNEEEEEDIPAQAAAAPDGAVSAYLEARIDAARGSGRPLPDSVRNPMERAFRADFSSIRIHTDSTADGLNRAVQARAFTTRRDIFFRSGEYNPDNSAGQHLIAHELAHTLQQGAAGVQRFPVRSQNPPSLQRDKTDFENKRRNWENFFSRGNRSPGQTGQSTGGSTQDRYAGLTVRKVPPVKKSKPWKIADYHQMGANLGGHFKGSELVDLSVFVEGIKPVAAEKDKTPYFENAVEGVQAVNEYGGKTADLSLGLAKTLGAGVVATIRTILAPVSDGISAITNGVKVVIDAFKKDSKNFWKDAWETLKSTFNAITSTTTSVLELIGKFEAVVPIVGGIAKGISAIVSFVEAVKGAIDQIVLTVKNQMLRSQIEEARLKAPDEQKVGDNKTQKERLAYYYSINQKRDKNIARQFIDKCSGIIAAGVKLASGVVSVIGGIALLTGVGATVTAVVDCFTLGLDAFEFVVNIIGKLFVYLPKVANAIRQFGRNIAAGEGVLGKVFKFLGFNPAKSSAAKEKERQQVVGGLIDSAARIKTEFIYSGVSSQEIPDEIKPELPKYEALDLELDAMGVNKKGLYQLNTEASLGKRLKGQIGMLYSALKAR